MSKWDKLVGLLTGSVVACLNCQPDGSWSNQFLAVFVMKSSDSLVKARGLTCYTVTSYSPLVLLHFKGVYFWSGTYPSQPDKTVSSMYGHFQIHLQDHGGAQISHLMVQSRRDWEMWVNACSYIITSSLQDSNWERAWTSLALFLLCLVLFLEERWISLTLNSSFGSAILSEKGPQTWVTTGHRTGGGGRRKKCDQGY